MAMSQRAMAVNKKAWEAMDKPCDQKRIDSVFGPLEAVIDDIERTGSFLTTDDGIPVFLPPGESEYCAVADALWGVADTFGFLGGHGSTAALRALADKIDSAEARKIITVEELAAARRDIAWMRNVSKQYTPNQMKEYIATSQISAEFRELGLAA